MQSLRLVFVTASLLSMYAVSYAGSSIDSKNEKTQDATDMAGWTLNLAGKLADLSHARKEALDKATSLLSDKPPGAGTIMHIEVYSAPGGSEPHGTPLNPIHSIVYPGGAGIGRDEAIKDDMQPNLHVGTEGERQSTEILYYEKKPDGSISVERFNDELDPAKRKGEQVVQPQKTPESTKQPPPQDGSKGQEIKLDLKPNDNLRDNTEKAELKGRTG